MARGSKRLPKKIRITRKIVDNALAYNEIVQNQMSREETVLRDRINKELSRRGFHLRLAMLSADSDGIRFDFVPPVHNWADELPRVDKLVTEKIYEYVRHHT